MAGVNKVIIIGNFGQDPELKTVGSGMPMCKFSLATSKRKKDGTNVTSWHKCVAFGKTAENIAQYCEKGKQIYIEGELSYGQYEKDGIVRYTTEVFVNTFSFIGSGGGGGGHQGGSGSGATDSKYNNYFDKKPGQPPVPEKAAHQDSYVGEGFNDYEFHPPKDDDIPF